MKGGVITGKGELSKKHEGGGVIIGEGKLSKTHVLKGGGK